MTDLHSALVAHTRRTFMSGQDGAAREANVALAALRAVVYLHPTEQHYTIGQDNKRTASGLFCRRCKASAPCEEIRTIAEKLGIKDQERIEEEERRG